MSYWKDATPAIVTADNPDTGDTVDSAKKAVCIASQTSKCYNSQNSHVAKESWGSRYLGDVGSPQ
ncbi:hypothetical protein E4U49_006296, partial [Claviceps purpurea]